jgi:hypothetical protein
MQSDHFRRAIEAAPRVKLIELASALWKAHALGHLDDAETQCLAELIEVRKALPIPPKPARRTGSRARSPASVERRRRWAGSGYMPPALAARFTTSEHAVLAVIAAEVVQRGLCRMPLGQIAALAGVCRTTVKNTLREARAIGLVTSEEWRIQAFRNAPNTVRIVSPEWRAWLRTRARKVAAESPRTAEQGGGKSAPTTNNHLFTKGIEVESGGDRGRKTVASWRPAAPYARAIA